jgi:hypothetical protein
MLGTSITQNEGDGTIGPTVGDCLVACTAYEGWYPHAGACV